MDMMDEKMMIVATTEDGGTLYLTHDDVYGCTLFTIVYAQPWVTVGWWMQTTIQHVLMHMGAFGGSHMRFVRADRRFRLAAALAHGRIYHNGPAPGHLYTDVVNKAVYLHLPALQVVSSRTVLVNDAPAFIKLGEVAHPGGRGDHRLLCPEPLYKLACGKRSAQVMNEDTGQMLLARNQDNVFVERLLDHGQLLSGAWFTANGSWVSNGCAVNVGQPVDVDQLRALIELRGLGDGR